MALPIYTKAQKLVKRIQELHDECVYCGRETLNGRSTFINSYRFKLGSIPTVHIKRGYDYNALLSTTSAHDVRTYNHYKNKHGGFVVQVHEEIDERYDSTNYSTENEFQLLLIHSEYELLVLYSIQLLKKAFLETDVNSLYCATTMTSQYTKAATALSTHYENLTGKRRLDYGFL